MVSPGTTVCEALAGFPLSRTCPARHAVVAADRVLKARTAHSQESILTADAGEDFDGAGVCAGGMV